MKINLKLPKNFIVFILALMTSLFICGHSKSALPFVTDDAFIQKPYQLALETFAEKWDLSSKPEVDKNSTTLYSYFLSASYGLSQHLELTMAQNIGYDKRSEKTSFMNPIIQLKTHIIEPNNHVLPAIAVDLGYANKNGTGEYFDPANNYYAIIAATSRFINDNLIIHLNLGKKASYNIPNGNLYRTHLGVGLDIALTKKIRTVVESYNGAPNSPRDSSNFFHSYQIGLKWVKSDKLSFYTIYGSQPTYAGNDTNGKMLFRNTSWVQVGTRIVFNNFVK